MFSPLGRCLFIESLINDFYYLVNQAIVVIDNPLSSVEKHDSRIQQLNNVPYSSSPRSIY